MDVFRITSDNAGDEISVVGFLFHGKAKTRPKAKMSSKVRPTSPDFDLMLALATPSIVLHTLADG
jgi:hypothetical protein